MQLVDKFLPVTTDIPPLQMHSADHLSTEEINPHFDSHKVTKLKEEINKVLSA